jgi:hypothetical protein
VGLAAVVGQVAVVVPSVRLTIDRCQAIRRVIRVRRDQRARDRLRGDGAVAHGVIFVLEALAARVGRACQALQRVIGVANHRPVLLQLFLERRRKPGKPKHLLIITQTEAGYIGTISVHHIDRT